MSGPKPHRQRKKVTAAAVPAAATHPKRLRHLVTTVTPDDREERTPTWSFALADHEHDDEWSWSCVGDHVTTLFPFLAEMERLTWRQIRQLKVPAKGNRTRPRYHGHPVGTLSPPARRRLEALGLDDVDEVYRFRLGGTARLWGVHVPQSHVFCLLWWDPDHRVYPVAR